MTEHDSGEGRLVSLRSDQSEYFVYYELGVDTQVTGTSERYDPAKVVKRYSLVVKARAGDNVCDGEYTLRTSREILRVRKTGTLWMVVA